MRLFDSVLEDLKCLHERKNSDYSNGENPFMNLVCAEQIGLPAWIGIFIRMQDKMMRATNLIRKMKEGEKIGIPSEKLDDTIRDLTIYGILFLCLYDEKPNPTNSRILMTAGEPLQYGFDKDSDTLPDAQGLYRGWDPTK